MSIVALKIGQRVTVTLPHSEACMHLRVAGKRLTVTVLKNGHAQIHDVNGNPLSFPVLWSEAGIYTDSAGDPYLQET